MQFDEADFDRFTDDEVYLIILVSSTRGYWLLNKSILSFLLARDGPCSWHRVSLDIPLW